MNEMFQDATSFNQPLKSWNTNKVTYMYSMFGGATLFNQPLKSWNTSQVTYMDAMFTSATSFKQDLNSWNTNQVNYMNFMFQGAKSFNHDISSWHPPIKSKANVLKFACDSPLLNSKSYWPKSSAKPGNFFIKSNIDCSSE